MIKAGEPNKLPTPQDLDKIVEFHAKIGPCEDSNCDACVMRRSVHASERINNVALHLMTHYVDVLGPEFFLKDAIAIGIELGMEFQRRYESAKREFDASRPA